MFSEYPYINKDDLNLDYILNKIKTIVEEVSTFSDTTEQLNEILTELENGDFPDALKESLINYVVSNVNDVIREKLFLYYFELSDEGYFIVNVPEVRTDVAFNTTGYDIAVEGVDFGHLTISY